MSNKISSAASFFRLAHKNRVSVTVVGGFCFDDWDEQVKSLTQKVINSGFPADSITVTDDQFSFNTGTIFPRIIRRSKLRRHRVGIMTVRSSDFMFLEDGEEFFTHCEKKGMKVVDNILVGQTLFNSQLQYKIIDN